MNYPFIFQSGQFFHYSRPGAFMLEHKKDFN